MPELLRAVFPCGSITGAPKHHTMELIADLETTPRGLYCGAIGWIDAPRGSARLGDFCLSVAIRTLTLGAPAEAGPGRARPARLGIGAGIVLDSVADDEYEECRLKGRFVTATRPRLRAVRDDRASRDGGAPNSTATSARLRDAAQQLGFGFDRERVRRRCSNTRCANCRPTAIAAAARTGARWADRYRHAPLPPLADGRSTLIIAPSALAQPAAVAIQDQRPRRLRRRHARRRGSRRLRQPVRRARRPADRGRAQQCLRATRRPLVTPPLDDGVLPGVMRSVLLRRSGIRRRPSAR